MGNRKWEKGNGKWEIGNGKKEMGNRMRDGIKIIQTKSFNYIKY